MRKLAYLIVIVPLGLCGFLSGVCTAFAGLTGFLDIPTPPLEPGRFPSNSRGAPASHGLAGKTLFIVDSVGPCAVDGGVSEDDADALTWCMSSVPSQRQHMSE